METIRIDWTNVPLDQEVVHMVFAVHWTGPIGRLAYEDGICLYPPIPLSFGQKARLGGVRLRAIANENGCFVVIRDSCAGYLAGFFYLCQKFLRMGYLCKFS